MPNIKSAEKRLRQNRKIRIRNKSAKSALRTRIRKFEEAVAAGDRAGATAEFRRSPASF